MQHPQWRSATDAEFKALLKNKTWQLVPPRGGVNIINCKWVFKLKRKADGTIDRYKHALLQKDSSKGMELIILKLIVQ